MKTFFNSPACLLTALVLAVVGVVLPMASRAQIIMGSPPDTDAQRNDMQNVKIQTRSLVNACNQGFNDASDPYQYVLYNFNSLRAQYNLFRNTMTSQQVSRAANEWSELDSGLDILAEAFSDYQEQTPAGTFNVSAFRNMCSVLGQASGVWLSEFTDACGRSQIGW
ncbi:MAG TPA: hypothetical protein PKA41_19085 [Verrucomicrobiota bacterium]|nr:hypothetical protein [Verrucomicrobiota bacterium]